MVLKCTVCTKDVPDSSYRRGLGSDPGMDFLTGSKTDSLLVWINSFKLDTKVGNLSQLSDGVLLTECLRLLEFRLDNTNSQLPLEFVVKKLSDVYGCDLMSNKVLDFTKISAGQEAEIAKLLVLVLCAAVKYSENGSFIEAIRSLPESVQFDLKYFIETTLEQVDNGNLSSGVFTLGLDKVQPTPPSVASVRSQHVISIASPAVHHWLCSPCPSDVPTPKVSNHQLFEEALEAQEMNHKLRLMERDLEIQRSLVMEYESEIDQLNVEKNNLILGLAERDEQLHKLQDKCEELDHMIGIRLQLEQAEQTIRTLEQQLETSQRDESDRSELQRKVNGLSEEVETVKQARNVLQVKLLKSQHQVKELEFEVSNHQAQSSRNLKRYNDTLQKVEGMSREINELRDSMEQQKQSAAIVAEENLQLKHNNGRQREELTLFQEQYTAAMCSVGSKEQEVERLQVKLEETQRSLSGEVNAGRQQIEVLQDQVTTLTERVKQLMADSEEQLKEFDRKEHSLSAELCSAKQLVTSGEAKIAILTSERDEVSLLVAKQQASLDSYKQTVNELEQQLTVTKETNDQEIAELTERLCVAETDLSVTRDQLQGELNKQVHEAETYCDKVALLEEKLELLQAEYTEAEEWHRKEQEQHVTEVTRLSNNCQRQTAEVAKQLDQVTSKCEMAKNKLIDQHRLECEELCNKLSVTDTRCASLQNVIDEKNKEFSDISNQLQQLQVAKEAISQEVTQAQLVASQQEQQLKGQVKMLSAEVEQLRGREMATVSEYQAYRNVMLQKEASLLQEMEDLKQANCLVEQKLKDTIENCHSEVTVLEHKLQTEYSEAEEWRCKQEQHLTKVTNDYQRQTAEVAKQLEQVTSECETTKNKLIKQHRECEELCQKLTAKEDENNNLQNTYAKRNEEFSDISNQLQQLQEAKEVISQEVIRAQLVTSQQEQQFKGQVKVLSAEMEQLRGREMATVSEYQAYRNVMLQKEASLLQEMEELKRANCLVEQKLKDTIENCHSEVTVLEQKLQTEYTEVEEWRHKQQEQHLTEVTRLSNDYHRQTAEVTRQLEQVTSECETTKNKLIEQHHRECEELRQKLTAKEDENISLQNAYAKRNEEFFDTSNQLQQLQEAKEVISQELTQAQLVASQQEQLLKSQVKVLSAEVEQLRGREMATVSEYQAYQNVMLQKEASLLQEMEDLKQANCLVEQKLKDTIENCHSKVTVLEQKLASLQIEYTKAEDSHRKQQEQHVTEVTKLSNDYQRQTAEVARQLEQVTSECETTKNKLIDQHQLECEELCNKLSVTDARCASLQNVIDEKDKKFSDISNQFQQLEKTKEAISQELTQTQLVASQQEQQLRSQVEMLSAKMEQLTAEYKSFQNMVLEKEASLLQEIENLKLSNCLCDQKLKENVNISTSLEEKLKKSHMTITDLESCLQRVRDEHQVTVTSYQETIDKEVSNNKDMEVKTKQLEDELNQVKQDSLKLSQDLEQTQSCLVKKEAEVAEKLSMWQEQTDQLMETNQLTVRRLEDDNCKLQQKLSSQKLAIQEISSQLTSTKHEHREVVNLLEQKTKEFLHLQTDYQVYRKNASTLAEQKEAKIGELQSQLDDNKQQSDLQLQALTRENEELVKSVDRLCSQQSLMNSQMEQECVRKFNGLELEKQATMEQIAKLQVEMTSLLNELEGLKCAQKETNDCLDVERDKNNVLEKELQQLKVMNKAFEKENARINRLLAQQKYGPNNSKLMVDTEQAHLQQLHSEMDQTVVAHVIPSSPHEGSGRLEELMARNSLIPPHLKSCYPIELQLQCGTPRSSEQKLKRNVEKSSCFDVSPPSKRPINSRKQQKSQDSPDSVQRRLSAPPTPTSRQPSVSTRMRSKLQLRSYLNEEQDENRAPNRVSDAFEISLTAGDKSVKSQAKMEERRAKVFQRMTASRKPTATQQVQQSTIVTNKPLCTRNTSKK